MTPEAVLSAALYLVVGCCVFLLAFVKLARMNCHSCHRQRIAYLLLTAGGGAAVLEVVHGTLLGVGPVLMIVGGAFLIPDGLDDTADEHDRLPF